MSENTVFNSSCIWFRQLINCNSPDGDQVAAEMKRRGFLLNILGGKNLLMQTLQHQTANYSILAKACYG